MTESIFIIVFEVAVVVGMVLALFMVINKQKNPKKTDDDYYPTSPYKPSEEDKGEYKDFDITLDSFISSMREMGISYDPILNTWTRVHPASGMQIFPGCPVTVSMVAYCILTPIYFDEEQSYSRRKKAKKLFRKITKWSYFTSRRVKSGLAVYSK